MKAKGQRVTLIFLGLVCLTLAVPAVLTWRIVRRERLNQALIAAVKANDTNSAITLLRQGADANARDEVAPIVPFWKRLVTLLRGSKPKSSTGNTPLMLALRWMGKRDILGDFVYPRENVALIRSLLKHGANVNCYTIDGETPLYFAIVGRKPATAHLLLAHGADVKKQGPECDLCVNAAFYCNHHPDVLQDLLDHGADVNQPDILGSTALWAAVAHFDIEDVKLLLAHHADLNVRGADGMTPLYEANQSPAKSGEIIHLLKAAGAKQ